MAGCNSGAASEARRSGRSRPLPQMTLRLATVAAIILLLTSATGAHTAQARPQRVPGQQLLVTLLTNHSVRARPNAKARVLADVSQSRPITGERTTLPVLSQTNPSSGRPWLRVLLPGRVLGQTPPPPTGWISASDTQLSMTPWRIIVDLNARQVTVERNGRPLRRYTAIVGTPSTPTPTGHYFVEENIRLGAAAIGGPFALATSDRSNVFQQFDGGPGQIALHGLDNLGGQLGTAESHGCIRLADSAITWLAARIAPGTPVTIA
jgi:lipoprotein-anchoring transpeptidase ErfK/SrfK